MSEKFKKIGRFIKLVMDEMEEDESDDINIPFDEFKELIGYVGDAQSITTICQPLTIRLNEICPADWNFKVGSRGGGRVVHISRKKKETYT